MSALDLISGSLEREKGFAPVAPAVREQLPGTPSMFYATYFGVPFFVTPLEADHLSEQELANLIHSYRELLASLRSSFTRGPFGLTQMVGQLWLLYSHGCSDARLGHIRGLKHFGVWPPVTVVPWVVDLSTPRVHRHRGFPLFLWPGSRFLGSLLNAGERAV